MAKKTTKKTKKVAKKVASKKTSKVTEIKQEILAPKAEEGLEHGYEIEIAGIDPLSNDIAPILEKLDRAIDQKTKGMKYESDCFVTVAVYQGIPQAAVENFRSIGISFEGNMKHQPENIKRLLGSARNLIVRKSLPGFKTIDKLAYRYHHSTDTLLRVSVSSGLIID